MSWFVRSAVALAMGASLAGCVVSIEEDDVFLPEMAEGTTFTIIDEDVTLFELNRPRDGLFEEMGVSIARGSFTAPTGRIAYRLARRSSADGPLIVYCGGNSFDAPSHGDLAIWKLAAHGDALIWDYPGYGDSGGAPSVSSFQQAAAALADRVAGFRRNEGQSVVFWGHSLGGFVCAEMAARAGATAIVFETSAPSTRAAARYMLPPIVRAFVRVRLASTIAAFDIPQTLEGTRIPALVLAGRRDRILPPIMSEELAAALRANGHDVAFHEFPDANHFHIGFQPEYETVVADALGRLYGPATEPKEPE